MRGIHSYKSFREKPEEGHECITRFGLVLYLLYLVSELVVLVDRHIGINEIRFPSSPGRLTPIIHQLYASVCQQFISVAMSFLIQLSTISTRILLILALMRDGCP